MVWFHDRSAVSRTLWELLIRKLTEMIVMNVLVESMAADKHQLPVGLLSVRFGHPDRKAVRLKRVGSARLVENSVAYHRNVLCRPDTCRSLMLEHLFAAGPARGTTGQKKTFPTRKRRPEGRRQRSVSLSFPSFRTV